MFPSFPYPLLPNFYSFFRTYIQAINRCCWSYLSMPFTGSYRTRLTGTLASTYPIAATVVFSKHKAEHATLLLGNFQWFFHALSWSVGSVCLGPRLLLHDSYTFSLDDLLLLGMCLASPVLSKPLSLPCPLHGVMLCPQLLPQWLSSPCVHPNVTASNPSRTTQPNLLHLCSLSSPYFFQSNQSVNL